MKEILNSIVAAQPDRFLGLSWFYREKNKMGLGIFSTLAGESFPGEWLKAIERGTWSEQGVYGDNFRECFGLTLPKG